MNPAPPLTRRVFMKSSGTRPPRFPAGSNRGTLRILKSEPQLLRKRVDGCATALPGSFGLEAYIADPSSPRRDRSADRAEVGAIGVLLIEPPNHVGRHPDERSEGGRRLDAVFASVPRATEHQGDLFEEIHEKL